MGDVLPISRSVDNERLKRAFRNLPEAKAVRARALAYTNARVAYEREGTMQRHADLEDYEIELYNAGIILATAIIELQKRGY